MVFLTPNKGGSVICRLHHRAVVKSTNCAEVVKWQTRYVQGVVSVKLLWVQVPPSAVFWFICNNEVSLSTPDKGDPRRPEARRDLPLLNERIRDREVRLIDEDGAQLGIVPTREALANSQRKGA